MKYRGNPSCPCGSGRIYDACCGRYIEQGLRPRTAEQLMRSRYTAYTLSREDYLLRTWHPSSRPASVDLDSGQVPKWLGLKVLAIRAGGSGEEEGTVEFVARYRFGGAPAGRLHETSRFVREAGEWFYLGAVDGTEGSV